MDLDLIFDWCLSAQNEFGFQITVAVVCGAVVGVERQRRGKAIGIRTSIMICLATQVFVRLSVELGGTGTVYDPTRVLGQIITGVGFLGAGVILSNGGTLTGVTSAAVVWMLAAIGSTVGAGRPFEALLLSFLVVVILIGIRLLERGVSRLAGGSDEPDADSSAS